MTTPLTAALMWQHFPAGPSGFFRAPVLITGPTEAVLIDGGFTLSDGRALAKAVGATGKCLTTIYVSQSDPDYYFSLGPIKEAFPEARVIAAPRVSFLPSSAEPWGSGVGYEGCRFLWSFRPPDVARNLADPKLDSTVFVFAFLLSIMTAFIFSCHAIAASVESRPGQQPEKRLFIFPGRLPASSVLGSKPRPCRWPGLAGAGLSRFAGALLVRRRSTCLSHSGSLLRAESPRGCSLVDQGQVE